MAVVFVSGFAGCAATSRAATPVAPVVMVLPAPAAIVAPGFPMRSASPPGVVAPGARTFSATGSG
jgi:hypothetical protein